MQRRPLLFLVFFLLIYSLLFNRLEGAVSEWQGEDIEIFYLRVDSVANINLDRAEKMVLTILDLSENLDSNTTKLYIKLAEIYTKKQNYSSAERYFTKALQSKPATYPLSKRIDLFLHLGRVYRKLGDYDQALKSDFKALSNIRKETDPEKYALICNYIGIDHYRYHNYKEAILYFNRSIEIRKKRKDSIGTADCYNNLGMVYDDQGKLEEALTYYQKGLNIYGVLEELDGIAASYNNLAGIYYQKNDFSMAMEYMLKVLNIRRKDGNKRKLSFSLLNTASLYFALKDIEKSIEFNLEGLQLAIEIGAKSQQRIAYKALSDAYLFQENYKNALEFQLLYAKVKDSIFEENKTKAIAEIHTKYETEKKEIENQLLRNENKTKSRNQIFLIGFTIGLIVLILMLIYYLRLRNKNLKQQKALNQVKLSIKEQETKHLQDIVFAEKQINQLQKERYISEIELKNKQLLDSTVCLVNKNEVLGKLKVEINSMDSSFKQKSEIISFINTNIDMDTDWNKFKIEFEEAHPGFFDRLLSSFPELSETYQKLCAFLRIGLSSQEISGLLFVSLSTVNKNRQRLRKKLLLESEANITDFLEKI